MITMGAETVPVLAVGGPGLNRGTDGCWTWV